MPDIRTVAETGSTNDDIRMFAVAGEPEGFWLRADSQTGGRGRRGREWQSPPGNLYASTFVRVNDTGAPAASLALVAGVALYDALIPHLRHSREGGNPAPAPSAGRDEWGMPREMDSRFRGNDVEEGSSLLIKWPNDILLGGAKLAGILLEREGDAVIIGIGANLAHHPDLPDRPATSLAAHGPVPDPDTFLRDLATCFARYLSQWREHGIDPIRRAWLDRAHPIGTQLAAEVEDGVRIEGVFDGMNEEGALLLRTGDGEVRTIHAGDVFLI